MAGSISLPYASGIKLLAKSGQPGRAVMEFDREAGKSSDRPQRNERGAALYRHAALLQLQDGSDVIDVSVTTDREEGVGAFQEISLDPSNARITVSNQKDSFDLRVSVSGSWQGGKRTAS
ncbi:hypothetical protein [Microbacterium sp. LWO12-1.2]|uniref:hypothetical protein n=1 Tax=Microbacterium sp. LWO12-1.2 TaxID=3135261 RepID=UPI0034252107